MRHHSPTPNPDAPRTATALPPQTMPVHDARALTSGDNTAMIVLDDKAYCLRITRAGKLILTK